MNDEATPFIEYWQAVDAAMLKMFGIDTAGAEIEAALIASAQDACQTPEEFARWYGMKHDLTFLDELSFDSHAARARFPRPGSRRADSSGPGHAWP